MFLSTNGMNVYVRPDNYIDKKTFLDGIRECVELIYGDKWRAELDRENSKSKKGKNKLRTYRTFKHEFVSEPYVYMILPKSHRSAYAKFRSGTAPIKLETGRYEGLAVEEQICPVCHNGVEDEMHVL